MAGEHVCNQEKLLGQMASDIGHIKDDQAETKDTTSKIFKSIEGKNGLVSRMAVQETKVNNMPSPKAIMIQASIWGGFTGGAVVILRHFL